MMMLMMAFLLLTSISVSAKQPTDINLEAGYVDPEDEGGDPHRSPILIPEVGIDNYTFDTAGWESGIYIVRVTIGDEVLSEKVVVK